MFSFLYLTTDDGSYVPSVWGYTLTVVLILVLLVAASFVKTRISSDKRTVYVRRLAFSSIAVALAVITSMIRVLAMPMGGLVTLLSMLFITIIGSWYGLSQGIMCGVAYGLLQLFINPYIISIPQLFCDYIFAFGALGLSGLFFQRDNAVIKGYIVGILGRFFFSVLSGVIFFASYAPSDGILSHPLLYSAAYNGIYIFAEGIITIIIISLPPVKKALSTVQALAAME